jgi:uncharacterized protein
MMNGKYTISLVGTSEYHWSLTARNAQTMLSSRIYAAKAGVETGIESCRVNSLDEARYERMAANDSRCYFVLKTAEGEVIGTSETYHSARAREQAIALCKESGPLAEVAYATQR